ncbi:MAG: hypothetical protein ACTSPB_10130 [Candidatus Thorarchaeota archaeon]
MKRYERTNPEGTAKFRVVVCRKYVYISLFINGDKARYVAQVSKERIREANYDPQDLSFEQCYLTWLFG